MACQRAQPRPRVHAASSTAICRTLHVDRDSNISPGQRSCAMVGSVEELEGELITLSESLTSPRGSECLFCYTYRMLNSLGCNGKLRWAARWRDLRAPRAAALERRLGDRGGYCDCEIFMNGWTASSTITTYDFETDEEVGQTRCQPVQGRVPGRPSHARCGCRSPGGVEG